VSATGGIPMPLRSWNRRHLAVAGAVLLVAAAFLLGYLPRRFARSKLAASTAAQQGPPRVAVTKAVAVDAGRTLSLPADLVARVHSVRHYNGQPIPAAAITEPLLKMEAVPA